MEYAQKGFTKKSLKKLKKIEEKNTRDLILGTSHLKNRYGETNILNILVGIRTKIGQPHQVAEDIKGE